MERQRILEKVRRIEDLELALTVFNAERALAEADKHLEVIHVGDCRLLMEEGSPDSPYYNRVKGFGRKDLDRLEEILDVYHKKGIKPCFDMTPDHLDEHVGKALSGHGYTAVEQLAFLELVPEFLEGIPHFISGIPENLEGARDGIRIEEVREETAEDYVRIIMESNGGMDIGDDVVSRKKHHFHQPHFRNLVAFIGDEVAGIGSLFIKEREGYIANDFTFEAFRGRGVQKALIAYRMREAEKLGLERLYTDVEFGSASHQNFEKCGFRTVFLNTFFMVL
ncbi:MAG TPA: GNAT family N-acetyltransferase [Clostridiaceae bacterium]|nr:GNAT family N-acetyltransferase [Clostridiaceae bacterium]